LATFLENCSLDRAPGRFADYLFVPKHQKSDVLLTTVLGPLRCGAEDRLTCSVCRATDCPRSWFFWLAAIVGARSGGLDWCLLFGPHQRAARSVERPLFPTEMDIEATGSGFFLDPGAKKAGYPAKVSRRAGMHSLDYEPHY